MPKITTKELRATVRASVKPLSNRSRGGSGKRRKRTLLGGASIEVRAHREPLMQSTYQGRKQSNTSRIPREWSDTHRKVDITPIKYDHYNWAKQCSSVKPLVLSVGHTQTFKGLTWRGPECLYDWCVAMPHRGVLGARLYQPCGSLPEYKKPLVKPPTAQQIAIDKLVADWRARQQLAYLQALGVET